MDKTKIEYRKRTELVPYERNPRKNERAVAAVAASIEEFGFKSPIIVDKDDVIVAGHTRLKAAEKAAAEKAAAEKAAAVRWRLSEREWEIIRGLSDGKG